MSFGQASMYASITTIDFLDRILHRFIDSAEDGGFTVSPVRLSLFICWWQGMEGPALLRAKLEGLRDGQI